MLSQVDAFNYLQVLVTSGGKRTRRLTGKLVMCYGEDRVEHESKAVNLPSIYVPTLTL